MVEMLYFENVNSHFRHFVCNIEISSYICTAHFTIWIKEFRGSIHHEMYRALRFLIQFRNFFNPLTFFALLVSLMSK
jgi:hypothetical protein